ncbi:hypothetical protein AMJ52_09300, partial [candidate division TA06 bacterium DG_78]
SKLYYYTVEEQDWNLWEPIGAVASAISESELEAQIFYNALYMQNLDTVDVLFYMQSWDKFEDFSDTVISNEKGILSITQQSVAENVIIGSGNKLLRLELEVFNDDITLDELRATRTGEGSDSDIEDIWLEDENGYTIAIGSLSNGVATFWPDLDLSMGMGIAIYIAVDVGSVAVPGNSIGFNIEKRHDVEIDKGVVSLKRIKPLEQSWDNSYVLNIPENISIDGAFADWEGKQIKTDIEGDVNRPNIDILKYGVSNSDLGPAFYLKVDDEICGGVKVPYWNTKIKPEQITGGGPGEGGTTPEILPKTGEDVVYIFIDTISGIGYSYNLPISANYMIEVRGRYNKVLSSSYYEWSGISAWDWTKLGPVEVSLDTVNMEVGLNWAGIGLNSINDSFEAYFLATDWEDRERDYSDTESIVQRSTRGTVTGIGSVSDHRYGWDVSYAGDINGDGYDDIIIGAPYYDIEFRCLWGFSDKKVNQNSDSNLQQYPAVAVDSSGNAIIAWADKRDGNWNIYAQKLDPNGTVLWGSSDVKVNQNSDSADQQYPAVTIDPSGNAIVVWADDRNSNWNIYAQKLDSSGTAQWGSSDKLVNQYTSSIQDYPDVAIDSSVNAIVVWRDVRSGGDIYAQKLDSSGTAQWGSSDKQVNQVTTDVQLYPAIDVDSSGNAIVVWEDYRSGSRYDVYAQKLNSNGDTQWGSSDKRVNQYTSGSHCEADVAVDSSGNAIVVWYDYRNYDIYAQKLNAAGDAQWGSSDKLVNQAGNGGAIKLQDYPAVDLDSSGNAIVAWRDYRSQSNYDIYAQKLDSSGNVQWGSSDKKVNQNSDSANQQNTGVAVDSNGDAIIVWDDERNGTSDDDIYGQKIGPSLDAGAAYIFFGYPGMDVNDLNAVNANVTIYGENVGDHFGWSVSDAGDMNSDSKDDVIIGAPDYDDTNVSCVWGSSDKKVSQNVGGSNAFRPAVAIDQDGNAIIVWFDERNGDYDIFAQKLDSDGNVQWGSSDVKVNQNSDSDAQGYPAVAVDSNGNAIVVWSDYRSGTHYDIYAQKLDSNGSPVWGSSDKKVNQNSDSADQGYPDIALDSSGNAIIVWEDLRSGSHNDIYAQKLNPNGNAQWGSTDKKVNQNTDSAWQANPAVAVTSNGVAIIVWEDERNGLINVDIYAQKLDPSGVAQWGSSDRKVNQNSDTEDQIVPDVVLDSSGNAIVVWYDYRSGSHCDIYAQKLDSSGVSQWGSTDKKVNQNSDSADQQNPAVTVDSNGNAIVVWEDERNGAANPDIYAQELDSVGDAQWGFTDMKVNQNSDSAGQYYPNIAFDSSGDVIIVWEDGRDVKYNIYAQKIKLVCLDKGRAYIFYGTTITNEASGDAVIDLYTDSADVTLKGESGGDRFGFSVSSAGDVNNDNCDDAIVGAYGYGNDKGRAYIFYGATLIDEYNYVDEYDNTSSGRYGSVVNFNNAKVADDNYANLTEEDTGGPGGNEYLYVDGFGAEKTEWTEGGSAPYLDAIDDPLNRVYTAADAAQEGDWTFADSTFVGSFSSSQIELYCEQWGTLETISVYIHDGSSWSNVGSITPDASYSWKTLDTSSVLNTEAKIDAAKMYVVYQKSGKADVALIDCARIYWSATALTRYEMDVQFNTTSVTPAEEYYLQVDYKIIDGASAEDFDIYAYDSTGGWEDIGDLTSNTRDQISIQLPDAKYNGGNVKIRYLGKDESVDSTQNQIYIYYHRIRSYSGGADAIADVTLEGIYDHDKFGFSVSNAGNVDNNYYDDVIVGAPGTDKAYIFLGEDELSNFISASNASVTLSGTPGTNFGFSVASCGNINNADGDDLIVGAPGYNADRGRAYIFYGVGYNDIVTANDDD